MSGEKIGIVAADYYADITDKMLDVAKVHIKFLEAEVVKIIRTPGSFELPLAAKKLLSDTDIDGVVALGAVIEGDTDHDQIVATNAARKLADLALDAGKPVGLGISGPKMTRMDAVKRIEKSAKGAVESVVKMLRRLKE